MLALLALAGCINRSEPLQAWSGAVNGRDYEALDYHTRLWTDGQRGACPDDGDDCLFVGLTLSGGGTRSAAFSYGVMAQLQEDTVTWGGVERSVLSEVDVISSASGGSFPNAWYSLVGPDCFFWEAGEPSAACVARRAWLREQGVGLSDEPLGLSGRMLSRKYINRLATRTVLGAPVRMFSLRNRTDAGEDIWDNLMFSGATIGALRGALIEHGAPFSVMNTTDIVQGNVFPLISDWLDYAGIDALSLPVARAATASSAFPFGFRPVSLRNFPQPPGYEAPAWIDNALAGDGLEENRYRYLSAEQRVHYLRRKDFPNIHLQDGGLADNAGLRYLIHSLNTSDEPGLNTMVKRDQVGAMLFVVVNARTRLSQKSAQRRRSPTIPGMLMPTGSVAMNNYTDDSIFLLQDVISDQRENVWEAWLQDVPPELRPPLDNEHSCHFPVRLKAGDQYRRMDVYVAVVEFIASKDPDMRETLLNMPTTFQLSDDKRDTLIEQGKLLLSENVCYQAFLDQQAQGPLGPEDMPAPAPAVPATLE